MHFSQAKAKRECPICNQQRSNMISHVKMVHQKSHQEAIILSQSIRREKKNPKKLLARVSCPIEDCGKPVKRLDKHLKTVHGLSPGSPRFSR